MSRGGGLAPTETPKKKLKLSSMFQTNKTKDVIDASKDVVIAQTIFEAIVFDVKGTHSCLGEPLRIRLQNL